MARFELTASFLPRKRSTTDLHQHMVAGSGFEPETRAYETFMIPFHQPALLLIWPDRRESNPHSGFRRTMSYPLNDSQLFGGRYRIRTYAPISERQFSKLLQ